MKLSYFDINKTPHLIEELYHISYSEKIVPLESMIIPLGFTGLVYVYSKGLKATFNNNQINLKGLFLNGQFNKAYKFNANEAGYACGLSFKATTLHKLTNLDISKFTNQYLPFNLIDSELSSKFNEIFINHNNDFFNVFKKIEDFILELPLTENKNIIVIDNIVKLINSREGMISVNELLKNIPFGQKTLETQFKKIVGLTPVKYIRIQRFKNLMKQYENKKIDLKDLIYMYDYYDESHFSKEFKSFTSRSFKEYFKDEFILIKKVFKN